MYAVASTNDFARSSATISPILKGTCTLMSIVAIMSANSTPVEPLRNFGIETSQFISTPYVPTAGYNGNISMRWDGISFMSAKIADSLQRLIEIAALQDNWNGNGASAFSQAIIDKAKSLVLSLSMQPVILPTGRDSIQMEYENKNGDYLEFELFENGRLKLFSYTHEGVAETKDISLDLANEVVCDFYERNI